ncbi:pyruvoyl-dependent arginine decarboxylase [Halobaculum sp. MBLA0147]|uniref:pyruvoyl-dependent arginine decarboxylase n=1 Tax=Halobaculum sp. MBLA0147 TaxID=3079934 RepID=UPI003523F7A2
MEIHVAAGVGHGPTELSAFDAALADAGVGDYNLVTVSSVVPADGTVRVVDRAPDLGPAGGRLTVVRATTTAAPTGTLDPERPAAPRGAGGITERVVTNGAEEHDASSGTAETTVADTPTPTEPDLVAGLGWATGPGPGLFYEATGDDPAAVRDRIVRGLEAGGGLRDWDVPERTVTLATAATEPDAHVAAVVVAAYGGAEPIATRVGGDDDRTRQV